MPFGLKNAPDMYQRMMTHVIEGLENTDVYINDVAVYSDNCQDHLKFTRALLERLSFFKLTVSLKKC